MAFEEDATERVSQEVGAVEVAGYELQHSDIASESLLQKTRHWTGVVRAKNTPLEAPGGGTKIAHAPEIGGRTVVVMKL